MKPTSRKELGNYLNHLGLTGLGVEVGVAYGENSFDILSTWKGYGLFLIDPYDVSKCDTYIDTSNKIDFDKCLIYCRDKLRKFDLRTIHIRDTSDNAVQYLKGMQLDFVYLDGNHHNPQITRDLENYWQLIKPGGLLCGHDYYNLDTPEYKCEVQSSVDQFLAKTPHKDFFVTSECTSWYLLKPVLT